MLSRILMGRPASAAARSGTTGISAAALPSFRDYHRRTAFKFGGRTSSSSLGWIRASFHRSIAATLPWPSSLSIAKRYVQFEHSSETLKGINEGKRPVAAKWISKSTKEYLMEVDSKSAKGNDSVFARNREMRRDSMAKRREKYQEVFDETDRTFNSEMDRFREDSGKRRTKSINFFKRQGKAFTLVYLGAYLGTLLLLYLGFASGVLKKDKAFEFIFFLFGKYIDREKFFERIEAWDSFTNFGFAFVINEMLEVFRFPLVLFTFYQCRPYLTGINRRVKASIFRFNAAES